MSSWRLPLEVLEVITDFAQESSSATPDYSALLTMALVCRSLRPRAQYNLLRHVVLKSAIDLHRFLALLRTQQHIAKCIGEITVLSAAHEYMPLGLLGGLLPNIPTLTLSIDVDVYPPTYTTTFLQFRGVRCLQLRDMHLPNELVLWRIAKAFVHLEYLTLHGLRLKVRLPTVTARCSQATRLPEGLNAIQLQVRSSVDGYLSCE
ncbi:hypothetical protein ONZ51_g6570 [Trametes cubensis]|uniref:Uncharacterized protein n=1 Tax=Trametes cubensis TaxID=1111947 RepID=A0AAD7TTY4_9APHY|nr:hypothetical protein ONZ51_g6570 [Trametes cubensis]